MQNNITEEEYITTKEVMAILRCGRTTLWKLSKSGKIKQFFLTPTTIRYSKQNIFEYIESCLVVKDMANSKG